MEVLFALFHCWIRGILPHTPVDLRLLPAAGSVLFARQIPVFLADAETSASREITASVLALHFTNAFTAK
jgi:hypothetical protein